jgi:hypothetical protein
LEQAGDQHPELILYACHCHSEASFNQPIGGGVAKFRLVACNLLAKEGWATFGKVIAAGGSSVP